MMPVMTATIAPGTPKTRFQKSAYLKMSASIPKSVLPIRKAIGK